MSKRKIVKNLIIRAKDLEKSNFTLIKVDPYEDYHLPEYDPIGAAEINHIIQVGGDDCNFIMSFNGELCQELFSLGHNSYLLMRVYEKGKYKSTALYTTCEDVNEILPIKPTFNVASQILEEKKLSEKSKQKLLNYAFSLKKE